MIPRFPVGLLVLPCLAGCRQAPPDSTLPVETEFFLLNLTGQWYSVIELRPTPRDDPTEPAPFVQSKLLPPGAIFREDFLKLFPTTGGCPDRLDLRIYLFKRNDDATPIDNYLGETVDTQAMASAEFLGQIACAVEVVSSTYTIVLRLSEEGSGVVVLDQDRGGGTKHEFQGTDLEDLDSLPEFLEPAPLAGQVLMPAEIGETPTPVPEVGVILRTRVRVNVDPPTECCAYGPSTVADLDVRLEECCLSEPIDVTVTDAEGRFSFTRPPGVYFVEVFHDEFCFSPVAVLVESPIDNIIFVAEKPCSLQTAFP